MTFPPIPLLGVISEVSTLYSVTYKAPSPATSGVGGMEWQNNRFGCGMVLIFSKGLGH